MKKRLFAVLTAAILSVALCFALACGGGEEETGGQTTYEITAVQGTDYSISVKDTAEVGEIVEVTVSVTDEDTVVQKVLANDIECTYVSEGKYTFEMPDADVSVTASVHTYQQVTSDGMLTLADGALTTIARNATYPSDMWEENVWKLRVGIDANWMTALSERSEITSSDQSVIPDDAITVDLVTSYDMGGSNNSVVAADICIDTSRISVGSSWLTIYLRSANTSSDGELVLKITVVEYGDISVPAEDKTVNIDLSEIGAQDGDTYTMHFYDLNYVDGGSQPEYFDVTAQVAHGQVSFTFDYATGHKYSITLSPGAVYDYDQRVGLSQSVTGGVNDRYDGYADSGLMFVTADEVDLEAYILTTN